MTPPVSDAVGVRPPGEVRGICFSFFACGTFLPPIPGRNGGLVNELTRRGHRVFYYDYPPVRLRSLVSRRLRELCSLPVPLRPRFDPNQNPTLIPAPIAAPAFKLTGLTRRIERMRLRRVLRPRIELPFRLEPERCHVALVDNPWWRPFVKLDHYRLVCYDLMDHFEVFSGKFDYRRFEVWEHELLKMSNVVFYSAESLREYAASRTQARMVSLPNAGDAEFFRHQAATLPVPADIAAVPGPRVGFVGAIFRWLDFNLMAQVMKSMPEVSFVFIGPVENWQRLAALTELANFHHLGVKPYSGVAAYVAAFDVCICPFKTDDVGQAVDPVKVYDYFALGKPVVTTRIREMAKLHPLAYVADSPEQFAQCIRQALAEKNPELTAGRVEHARANSWSRRVDLLLSVIEEELRREELHRSTDGPR